MRQIWNIYRVCGDAENRIKELKYDFGTDSFCLKKFFATEAAFRFIMIGYRKAGEAMIDNNSEIYNQFVDLGKSWGEAILNGDNKTANKNLKKIEKIIVEVRKTSDSELLSFLKNIKNNESIGVAFLATNYLLCFDDKAAEEQMVAWKQRKDIFSSNANMALDLWKQKLLRLPK